jgi:methionine-gamma-lyase
MIEREPRGIENPHLKTICVRSGYDPFLDSVHGDIIPPIHMATTYAMPSNEDARQIIVGEQPGYVYGRFGNPTVAVLERCFAELECAEAAIAFASGNAAHNAVVANSCSPGDNIVLHRDIYGGTSHLVGHRSKLTSGVEARFVEDPTDLASWEACMDEKTQFAFMEVPTNPHGNVYDIRGVAACIHKYERPLVVDSTLSTPIILRPLEHGADIVSHSGSKYAAGFSQSMAGILNGDMKFVDHIYKNEYRDMGALLAPMDAWLIRVFGISTLYERMQNHASNTKALLCALQSHSRIKRIWHPFSDTNPTYELAFQLLDDYTSLLYLELDTTPGETERIADAHRLCVPGVHLGTSETMITICEFTTHGVLTPEERTLAGIVPNGIRISVGRENPSDIIDDVLCALGSI